MYDTTRTSGMRFLTTLRLASDSHKMWFGLSAIALMWSLWFSMPAAVAAVAWTLMYVIVNVKIGLSYPEGTHPDPFVGELASRIVSVVHTFVVVPVAIGYLLGGAPVDTWYRAQHLTMGYLIYDATYLTGTSLSYALPLEKMMLAHHVSFFLGLILLPTQYQSYVAMAYLAELTNPFLYAGWFMYKTGLDRKEPKLFAANAVILLVIFFIFRVLNFTVLLYIVVDKSWICTVLCAMLWVAQLKWFWKLFQKFLETTRRPRNISVLSDVESLKKTD